MNPTEDAIIGRIDASRKKTLGNRARTGSDAADALHSVAPTDAEERGHYSRRVVVDVPATWRRRR